MKPVTIGWIVFFGVPGVLRRVSTRLGSVEYGWRFHDNNRSVA